MYELLKNIGYGAFYGGQAALFGYLKDENLPKSWSVVFTKRFWNQFDPVKAAKTVSLGVLLGAFGVVKTEYNMDPILINFFNDAIVIGIDQLIKTLVRRTPIVRVWNALKTRILGLSA